MSIDNIQAFIDECQVATEDFKNLVEDLTSEFTSTLQPMIVNIDILIKDYGNDVQAATDKYKQRISDAYDQYITNAPTE